MPAVGLLQFQAVLDHGLAYARSNAFIERPRFRALTWLRSIGVVLFITGGVIPLSWFMVTRWLELRRSAQAGAATCHREACADAALGPYESYVSIASD